MMVRKVLTVCLCLLLNGYATSLLAEPLKLPSAKTLAMLAPAAPAAAKARAQGDEPHNRAPIYLAFAALGLVAGGVAGGVIGAPDHTARGVAIGAPVGLVGGFGLGLMMMK